MRSLAKNGVHRERIIDRICEKIITNIPVDLKDNDTSSDATDKCYIACALYCKY